MASEMLFKSRKISNCPYCGKVPKERSCEIGPSSGFKTELYCRHLFGRRFNIDVATYGASYDGAILKAIDNWNSECERVQNFIDECSKG